MFCCVTVDSSERDFSSEKTVHVRAKRDFSNFSNNFVILQPKILLLWLAVQWEVKSLWVMILKRRERMETIYRWIMRS